MTEQREIEAATKRLLLALDALEAAIERRRESDRAADNLAAQVQALSADRSRLASALDASKAASRRSDAVNRDVAARIDKAVATISAVLAEHDEAEQEPGAGVASCRA